MNSGVIILVLSLVWAAITGNFDGPNLLLGAAIGAVVATVLRRAGVLSGSLRRLVSAILLGLLLIYELGASAVRVAIVVLSHDVGKAIRPAIVAFPLSVTSDPEITLLANLITLTPGTLSLDVSADRKFLYIHVLALEGRDKLIADIAAGFEAKVREVYR